MVAYVIRRLLLIIPTIFILSLIVFFAVRFIPGSVLDLMTTEAALTKMEKADIQRVLGLDVPIPIQYVRWMSRVILHGDLGKSLWSQEPIASEVADRLPVTAELALLALVVALLIAIPVGVYSAIRQDTIGDYVSRSFAIMCIATPYFWLGTLVMILPAIWWNWSPSITLVKFTRNPMENLKMFIIPAAILGMSLSGVTMRMLRTTMLEVLRQDFIRTAWSKGLTERLIVSRHAIKNAVAPVVTLIGVHIPWLVGGTVIIENIFCLPGIGALLYESILKRDYPVVSGVMLFMGVLVLLANLLVDLSYAYLDPRIQYK